LNPATKCRSGGPPTDRQLTVTTGRPSGQRSCDDAAGGHQQRSGVGAILLVRGKALANVRSDDSERRVWSRFDVPSGWSTAVSQGASEEDGTRPLRRGNRLMSAPLSRSAIRSS